LFKAWGVPLPLVNPTESTQGDCTPKKTLAALLMETRWQIYFSAVAAVILSYGFVISRETIRPPFENVSQFQGFLFGVGGICAIIAPLVFGLAIQQGHKADSEKLVTFRRYQDLVIELRAYLNELYSAKGVNNRYLEFLSSLEMTKSSEFDLSETGYRWWDIAAAGLIRWMEDEAAGDRSDVDFDDVHHELMPRLQTIEDCIDVLQVNAVRRAIVGLVLIKPAINLFWMIGLVVLLAMLSSVTYAGVAPYVFFTATMFIASFLMMTIYQLKRYASFETREFMRE
jgi:hypothetical protein